MKISSISQLNQKLAPPRLIGKWAGFVSEHVWGRLPMWVQARISRAMSRLSEMPLSRHFIPAYCWFQYGYAAYHHYFKPGNNQPRYNSFQDFFTREFSQSPSISSSTVWPCEGLLCDSLSVETAKPVSVKGELKNIRTIFGQMGNDIPDDYHFSNVFLHNSNYHHIHSPISGTITRIERIPGELLLLRPWAYENKPSLPALCNERVNLEIKESDSDKRWFVSIIGGPVVATIKLVEKLKIGSQFHCGEKLGGFLMGSTCCVASPQTPRTKVNQTVKVGDPY